MYVAVVITKNVYVSKRTYGDWSCFVGKTKDEAITEAIKAKNKWEHDHGGAYGPYEVYVGKLNERAFTPVSYKTEALEED